MEKKNQMESGFRVKNIILIDSAFSRINTVNFNQAAKTSFDIKTDVATSDNTVNVAEEVTLTQSFENREQFHFKVKMIGLFEKIGDTEIQDLETFGKINGAAIIFPYIREHITSIALKAGLGPLILPPINFAKQQPTK